MATPVACSPRAGAAEEVLRDAERAGVDLAAVTAQLEREGVQAFCDSYQQLLDRIESKTADTILTT